MKDFVRECLLMMAVAGAVTLFFLVLFATGLVSAPRWMERAVPIVSVMAAVFFVNARNSRQPPVR